MNELSIFVIMAIVCILWASITYSVGFKEGQRQGYARGRSITRITTGTSNVVYNCHTKAVSVLDQIIKDEIKKQVSQ